MTSLKYSDYDADYTASVSVYATNTWQLCIIVRVERPVQLQSTKIIKSTSVYTRQQSKQKHENIPQ